MRFCFRGMRAHLCLWQLLVYGKDELCGANRIKQGLAFCGESFRLRSTIHKLFCMICDFTQGITISCGLLCFIRYGGSSSIRYPSCIAFWQLIQIIPYVLNHDTVVLDHV